MAVITWLKVATWSSMHETAADRAPHNVQLCTGMRGGRIVQWRMTFGFTRLHLLMINLTRLVFCYMWI